MYRITRIVASLIFVNFLIYGRLIRYNIDKNVNILNHRYTSIVFKCYSWSLGAYMLLLSNKRTTYYFVRLMIIDK